MTREIEESWLTGARIDHLPYQLMHFARSFGQYPWDIPDDASIVAPYLAMMTADTRGQAAVRRRQERQAERARSARRPARRH